ncbi:MAG: RDD family protein [Lysobacteraceae bacterium]
MSAQDMPRSPAGFWKRYVAYFIDIVLVYIVVDALASLFLPSQGTSDIGQLRAMVATLQNQQSVSPQQTAMLTDTIAQLTGAMFFFSFAYALVAGVYFVLCESSAWQATLGKRLIGIKVVDADGQRIDRQRAIGRFLAAGLSWLSLNIGHAMAAYPPQHRALHDYLVGTRVENADPSRPQMPFWGWAIIGLHGLLFLLGIAAIAVAMAAVVEAINQF